MRRAPTTRKFSAASVNQLEREIHSLAQRMADKFLATRAVFNVQNAMSCYSTDVASLQVFGETLGFVQQEGFEPNLKDAQYAIFSTYHLFTWCSWIRWVALSATDWLDPFMPEEMRRFSHLVFVSISGEKSG